MNCYFNIAKKFKERGTKDLYDAFNSTFEGIVDAIWLECNDRCLHKWNRNCPCIEALKELEKIDEEMKGLAPLFCLAPQAIMTGFNQNVKFSLKRVYLWKVTTTVLTALRTIGKNSKENSLR